MTLRPTRSANPDALHFHLVSGETVRLRRFEAARIMVHWQMLAFYLVVWSILVLTDPSGHIGTTPLSVRLAQYGVGVSTVIVGIFGIISLKEVLLGGKGRLVRISDWPLVLLMSALGVATNEGTVFFFTGEMRTNFKIFAIMTVFYFVLAELCLQFIAWLLLPRMLSSLRRDTPAPEPAAIAPDFMLRVRGQVISPATILHLEAQGNYVAITTETTRHEVPGPFATVLAQIPQDFGLRIHRSHWVARRAVIGHQRKGREMVLVLDSGAQIPVALPRHAEVLDWLQIPVTAG